MTTRELTPEQKAKLKEYEVEAKEIATRTRQLDDVDRAIIREWTPRLYKEAGLAHEGLIVDFSTSPQIARWAACFAAYCYEESKSIVDVPYNGLLPRDEIIRCTRTLLGLEAAPLPESYTIIPPGAQDVDNTLYPESTRPLGPSRSVDGRWVCGIPDVRALAIQMFGGRREGEAAVEWGNRNAPELLSSGNMWSGPISTLHFYRDYLKTGEDYSKYEPWEKLGMHGGPRYMYAKFTVVSDFPTEIHLDNDNNPHNTEGPYARWADGTRQYAIRGMRVPGYIIERPDLLTISVIDNERNAEIRREMVNRFPGGLRGFLDAAGAKVIDTWIDEGLQPVRLVRRDLVDDEPVVAIHIINSTVDPDGTRREYVVRVPPTFTSAQAARNWSFGLNSDESFAHVS